MLKAPKFWYLKKDTILSSSLYPLSLLFRFGTKIRNLVSRKNQSPLPTICVGNIVVGGAGNVACNISAIGGIANLVAVTGDDLAGSQINNLLDDDQGVINSLIVGNDYATTVKTRFVADGQHLLRVDDESIDIYSKKLHRLLLPVML